MRYAVSYMNFCDNNLSTVIGEEDSPDWRDALHLHPELSSENPNDYPKDINDAKEWAFNSDFLFDVVLIEENK